MMIRSQEFPGSALPHPGEFLQAELATRRLSASRQAAEIGAPEDVVSDIIAGRGGVDEEIALKLAASLGLSAKFWLKLQQPYDLKSA